MKKLLIIIFSFYFVAAKAQYQKPYFNTLSVRSGLPEAFVQTTLEDKKGYIWMGTQNGLVRYDGYQLKPYSFPADDGLPIANPSIFKLEQERDGKIWAYLTTGEIYYYYAPSDKFIKVPLGLEKKDTAKYQVVVSSIPINDNNSFLLAWKPTDLNLHLYKFNKKDFSLQEYSSSEKGNYSIAIKMLSGICNDANGKIWLTGDHSLSYYDIPTQSFKQHFELPENLRGYNLTEPTPDPSDADVLWLNTDASKDIFNSSPELYGRKLLRFNTKTKAYSLFNRNDNDPYALRANCTKILSDSLHRLWFLTNRGISLFNSKQNNFINYDIAFPANNVSATTIAAEKNGNCWIAGNFRGLYYLNTTTGTTTLYKSNRQEGSLPFYRDISNLFFDRTGTLWVNMPYFGIAYLNKQKTLFAAQPIASSSGTAIPNNGSPFKIVGATGDSICYIADSSSLYAWHTRQNKFDKIALNKEVYQNIRTVVSSPDKTLWIGTFGSGLFQYNPGTKAVFNYTNNPNDSNSISGNNVKALTTDASGNAWIGTDGAGLCSFNSSTKKFTRYPYTNTNNGKTSVSKELADPRLFALYIDTKGLLWISTNEGFISNYNVNTKDFTNYIDRKKGLLCATSIYEDSQQRMWIGSYLSGLFLFDRKTGAFKNFTEQDGLLHNSILHIQEDPAGNIWCVSERGLSRLDPKTNKFTNFKNIYQDLNQRFPFVYRDAANTFRFSVESGIIHFNPADLKANPVAPSVVIESINYRVANDKTGRDTFLFPEAADKIRLSYNENKLGFQFVALHFADPANNQYAYQLEGYDKDWVTAGTQRTATYTNLSPGTYIFKVKAANSDGIWSTENPSITIIISPPWWQTWWAYVLYAIIFIAAISSFIAYRSAALKREKKILEEKVDLRTSQLRTSIEDLKATQSQLIHSEKMASLGELTAGIAHEIQNPLNFVNNFSDVNKELLEELKEEANKGNIDEVKSIADDLISNEQKINHHGKRADAIVKGMLQHSRSSSGVKEPTDINALCDEYLRLSYHGLRAKDKSFNAAMKTDFDESIGNINIIPQDIGRVILNLITNAFYAVNERKDSSSAEASEDKYEPTVTVSTKKINNTIEIKVADNGNGIPQNIVDKIFQPFFTTKPTGQGTGLGLSLSYDIVKAHGGELKVETKEGAGSIFIIIIPTTN